MTFLAEPRTVVHYFTSAPFAAVVQLLKGQKCIFFKGKLRLVKYQKLRQIQRIHWNKLQYRMTYDIIVSQFVYKHAYVERGWKVTIESCTARLLSFDSACPFLIQSTVLTIFHLVRQYIIYNRRMYDLGRKEYTIHIWMIYFVCIYTHTHANMTQPQISHSSRMSTPQPPRTSATEADIFHTMGVSWPPRSLLHGPPGSGKTQLLKWLEIQAPPPPGICSVWEAKLQWIQLS